MIKKDGLAGMKVQLVIQHKGKAKDDELQSNIGYTVHVSNFLSHQKLKNKG